MHSQIDLDPTHAVIRLTVLEENVSLECAEDCYRHLSEISSSGGPYAAIYDFSMAKNTTVSTYMFRRFARRPPALPMARKQVVVGSVPSIYELARLFQMCAKNAGKRFEVVQTLEQAYDVVGVRGEDFTERLFTGPTRHMAPIPD